jgi:5-methylcytosine-specific restriction endonuclease McrA
VDSAGPLGSLRGELENFFWLSQPTTGRHRRHALFPWPGIPRGQSLRSAPAHSGGVHRGPRKRLRLEAMSGDPAPQIPSPFVIDPDTIRAIKELQHEHRRVRMWEAFCALVELRRRFAGFSRRVVVMVYVPQCEDCYAAERHRFEADDSTWRPPDIHARTWRRDLREYGATEREIRRTYQEMGDKSREVPLVRCDSCRGKIVYGRDNVYVIGRPFEDHFPELVGGEDSDPPKDPPKYVRELVYRAYGGECAGCGISLTWDEKTMDHIRPKHVGGPGTLENIQLACAKCNNEDKGGVEPGEVHVWLDFLLVAQSPGFDSLARLAMT